MLLELLMAEVREQAKSAYGWGLRHFVALQLRSGEWIAAHAESEEHAKVLASHWVAEFCAKGAWCFRLKEEGAEALPFWMVLGKHEVEALA